MSEDGLWGGLRVSTYGLIDDLLIDPCPSCQSVDRHLRMGYRGLEGLDLRIDRQSINGSMIDRYNQSIEQL